MGSRPWRRTGVPPMPALIPIAALRNKSLSTSPPRCPVDNNNGTDEGASIEPCEPCDRVQHQARSSSSDIELGDEVRCSSTDEESGERGADGQREERSRRTAQQPSRRRRSAIDETPSRDGEDAEQAPARRPRPERHRKSDRRRREHRSDRLLRKRSTSGNGSATTTTTTSTTTNTTSTASTDSHRHSPTNDSRQPPRVNPIFVWVRQEDTRIVDVRCEDYDKRNRILLTKTAHGWRAIPRTETLATTLEEAPASHHHEHRHERNKNGPGRPRGRKAGKNRRRSRDPPTDESQAADIETHLPSHTITVPRRPTKSPPVVVEIPSDDSVGAEVRDGEDDDDIEEVAVDSDSVNSGVAQAPQCRVSSDASPLDSLLAVAELEFKHQVRGASLTPKHEVEEMYARRSDTPEPIPTSDTAECTNESGGDDEHSVTDKTTAAEHSEDCDYNDDEDENENQFSDMLERLEQSLQSPIDTDEEEQLEEEPDEEDLIPIMQDDGSDPEIVELDQEQDETEQDNIEQEEETEEMRMEVEKMEEQEHQEADEEGEELDEDGDMETSEQDYDSVTEKIENVDAQNDACEQPTDLTVTDQIEDDLLPTDLSTHSKKKEQVEMQNEMAIIDDMMPTDLSIRKHSSPALTIEPIIRPPSQNSETIQSPQPSGIPAVPPSPDIFPITKQTNNKSVFLESLLSASPKLSLNPELTITRNQKEPLDLGKGRKSASPTVTCSEEAKNVGEPAPKRLKMEDITLKNLLHAEGKQPEVIIKPVPVEKKKPSNMEQSSRLLELLTTDSVPDAMTQLKQLLADPHINIPDPMLVPKDRLSHILAAPAKEIPRLLVSRPELRLPEAFTHPTLIHDPDILVITMEQLQTILEKHLQPIPVQETVNSKTNNQKDNQKPQPATEKPVQQEQNKQPSRSSKSNQSSTNQQGITNDYHRYAQNLQHQQQLMMQEAQMKHHQNQMMRKGGLASDIDAATTAAFNQMMWLPYLNQLEAAAVACGNNQDFMKVLNSVFPPGGYPPQLPEHVPPMFNAGRFGMPNTFPMQPQIDYGNPLELAMWQEAMLRQKLPSQVQENNLTMVKQAQAYRESVEKRNQQLAIANKNKMNQMHHVNGHHNLNGHHHMNNNQQHLNHLNQQHRNQQNCSSARTNPIQHNDQQRNSQMHNNFMRPPVATTLRTNLQIPHYNSALAQAASQKPTVQRNQSLQDAFQIEKIQNMQLANNKHGMKYNNPFLNHGQKESAIHKQFQEHVKLPPTRINNRNLPNLPSSPLKDPGTNHQHMRTPGEPHKPIDLSGSKQNTVKFKMRPNIFEAGHFTAYQMRDEIAEVGSTTEEMNSAGQLHDTQTHHVWHPLFGK